VALLPRDIPQKARKRKGKTERQTRGRKTMWTDNPGNRLFFNLQLNSLSNKKMQRQAGVIKVPF
ncbi:hypothetical protein, partial [Paraprevotella clara]|uniref:hypothetical protein n=1 Tax=Paraprevotella clara TaxID=454154 RepID=UPI0026750E02